MSVRPITTTESYFGAAYSPDGKTIAAVVTPAPPTVPNPPLTAVPVPTYLERFNANGSNRHVIAPVPLYTVLVGWY